VRERERTSWRMWMGRERIWHDSPVAHMDLSPMFRTPSTLNNQLLLFKPLGRSCPPPACPFPPPRPPPHPPAPATDDPAVDMMVVKKDPIFLLPSATVRAPETCSSRGTFFGHSMMKCFVVVL